MANGGRDHTVIPIPAVKHIQTTTSLDRRIEETKWLLHPSAGNSSCCIFRVPQHFLEINEKAYRPRIVSIGPYHYGDTRLEMMQQHKSRFVRDLLARTPSNGPRLDRYRKVVASMEERIRGCYSETINLSSDDLVETMVFDGLFTVELFYKFELFYEYESRPPSDSDDPIFKLAWVLPNLKRDLLLLENQIPFFVLQNLFDESQASRKHSELSLAELALKFLGHKVERPEGKHLLDLLLPEGKHLLDLLRSSYSQRHDHSETNHSETREDIKFIQSAEKLHLAGIKFKTRDATSFLDIGFRKGVLEIPQITLDDPCTDLFINFVAFEQCYSHCSKDITTYAVFMSCLIRTPADVSFLCDETIIENYLVCNEKAADFFNNLGKDVVFDIDECYLLELFKDVNEYCRSIWHVQWARFKFKYFNTPWSFLSAVAAVVLLLLTGIQVFFAWYAYVRPSKSGG